MEYMLFCCYCSWLYIVPYDSTLCNCFLVYFRLSRDRVSLSVEWLKVWFVFLSFLFPQLFNFPFGPHNANNGIVLVDWRYHRYPVVQGLPNISCLCWVGVHVYSLVYRLTIEDGFNVFDWSLPISCTLTLNHNMLFLCYLSWLDVSVFHVTTHCELF